MGTTEHWVTYDRKGKQDRVTRASNHNKNNNKLITIDKAALRRVNKQFFFFRREV